MIDPFREIADPADLQRLNRLFPSRYPYLLQSTAAGGALGRFDILFCAGGETLELAADGELLGDEAAPGMTFLEALDRWWLREREPAVANKLPFVGGWFLFLSYELAAEIEPGLRRLPGSTLPIAFATRCRAALIFDHARQQCSLVRETTRSIEPEEIRRDLVRSGENSGLRPVAPKATHEEEPQKFLDAVATAQEHIAAGDVYQVNLCRQWTAEVDQSADGADIYASLCRANPAPFAGIARWRDVDIISSSPERLLRVS
ncbi:MAG: chorismate-binding protein, partial [Gammaproteobacteria bacterium]|nr:chorismate-binding protein [Gammaproteobacteria bacterium]